MIRGSLPRVAPLDCHDRRSHAEGEPKMQKLIRNFLRDESGEDLMEYGLLAAFVASVALAVIIADPLGLRTAIINAFVRAVNALNQA